MTSPLDIIEINDDAEADWHCHRIPDDGQAANLRERFDVIAWATEAGTGRLLPVTKHGIETDAVLARTGGS